MQTTYSAAGFWVGLAGPFSIIDLAIEFARLAGATRFEIEEVDATGKTFAVWTGDLS